MVDYKKIVKEQKTLFDKTLDEYDYGDCVEITGRMGGDVVTFRIYKKSGTVCER